MNRGKNLFGLVCVLFLAGNQAFAQDLTIGPDDLRIEMHDDGGFHLYIRKKPDIASVLLTESTQDPSKNADNFAYRAPDWNPVNGDEIRLLNGVPIPRESKIYSLISSIPVPYPELGMAFHIYIPWALEYGYQNSRHGEIYVTDGTFFNARAFSLPYADYRGKFQDNPFVLNAVQKAPDKPVLNFSEDAETAFGEISRQGNGVFLHASDAVDLVDKIDKLLLKQAGKNVDIVLCFDTTSSMGPFISEIKKILVPMLTRTLSNFADWRIGMVLFKDYFDEYLTKRIDFTKDFDLFQRSLNAIRARGGGDVPEAVYEGLYEAADKFPWAAESRQIILIGDAPPHPKPRGKIKPEMVYQLAAEKNLTMSTVILPSKR